MFFHEKRSIKRNETILIAIPAVDIIFGNYQKKRHNLVMHGSSYKYLPGAIDYSPRLEVFSVSSSLSSVSQCKGSTSSCVLTSLSTICWPEDMNCANLEKKFDVNITFKNPKHLLIQKTDYSCNL